MPTRPSCRLVFIATFMSLPAQVPAQRSVPPTIARYFELARAEYSGERARQLVGYMGGWFRWPGNTAFDASIDRVVTQLRAAGYVREDSAAPSARLVYRVERRPLRGLAWDIQDASLTIVGDRTPLLQLGTNLNMLAINSYSTPDSGVIAELVELVRPLRLGGQQDPRRRLPPSQRQQPGRARGAARREGAD